MSDKYYFHGVHWQDGPFRIDGFTDPDTARAAAEKYVDEHGSGLTPNPPIEGHEDDYEGGVFRDGTNRFLNVMREPPAWRTEQQKTSAADAIAELVMAADDVMQDVESDYRMDHRPADRSGIPLHDLTVNMPADVYDHPEWYDPTGGGRDDPSFGEAWSAISKARNNPDAKIRIYRSLPAEHIHQGIRPGDWVTTSKSYALQHGRHATDPNKDWPVIRTTVRAGDLHTDADDLREWGYNGDQPHGGMVAFKGGREQEVRLHADGTIHPVQRRSQLGAMATAEPDDGHLVLYHGTTRDRLPGIQEKGLTSIPGSPAGWFMLTDSKEQAERYTSGHPGGVVLEYHIPKRLSDYREDGALLWPGRTTDVYGYHAMNYAPKESIPASYIKGVHEAPVDPSYATAAVSPEPDAQSYLDQRYPGLDHDVSERPDSIVLHKVVVPKEQRGQGIGSAYMRDLTDYADSKGKRVELTPDTSFGGSSKGRLQRFYKGFGFVPNKDLSISNTMVRPASPGRQQTTTDRAQAVKFAKLAWDTDDPDLHFHVQASWRDVRDKAKRIRADGGVRILADQGGEIVAQVHGDHGIYQSEITFLPGSRSTAAWSCSCPYAAFAWGRTGQFKKLEGRVCSHVEALRLEARSRRMFGREVSLDVDTPHWISHPTVPVREPASFDRDLGDYPEPGPVPKAATLSFTAAPQIEVTGIGHAELAQHLQDWFHPQKLDADEVKHPKTGWPLQAGEERRVSHPEDGPDPHGLGPEAPAQFNVWDHGDPITRPLGQFAKKVRTEPIQHVYRGVHEDEWKQAQQRGYLQSDSRGAIVNTEGMNAAVDPRSAVSYLPQDGSPSRVLKIRVRPEDNWFTIQPDSYIRTRNQIPLDRIEATSPALRQDRSGLTVMPEEHTASVTVNYMRNNSGDFRRNGPGYGMGLEPWGKYMTQAPAEGEPGFVPDGWEHGQVTFNNPLRLEHEDGGWKQRLSQQHGGLVGKELSNALLAKGHDAVITHDKYGTGEIVDLRPEQGERYATGALSADDSTQVGVVPSKYEGHPGHPLHELDTPKGNSALRWHLIDQHGYDRGDIGRSPKKLHDELHATEDGIYHPAFNVSYDTIVHHRHKTAANYGDPGTEDLASSPFITRGFIASPDHWEKGAAERIRDLKATPEDILSHIDTADVGDFWHGHADSTPDAQDYASVDKDTHVGTEASDPENLRYTDGRGYLGELGVALVAHRPAGWDPNTNEPEMGGLMGNSYLPHTTDLKLHEIHYSDPDGNWHAIPAEGHSVHATGYLDRRAVLQCPADGQDLEFDLQDGWQHLDGSVSHDDGLSVTDHMQQAGIPLVPQTDAETLPYGYDDLTEFREDHQPTELTPEATSLPSAIAYAGQMVDVLGSLAERLDQAAVVLDHAHVEKPAVGFTDIRDLVTAATTEMLDVQDALAERMGAREELQRVAGSPGQTGWLTGTATEGVEPDSGRVEIDL